MEINIVVPHTGIAGGVRVLFEYANGLHKEGHTVRILRPIIPSRSPRKLSLRRVAGQSLQAVKRIKNKKVEWFDLNVPIISIPALNPKFSSLIERFIPEADITVASSWRTAYFVNSLSESMGEKAYFVQHYEIWPLWNNHNCWDQAAELHEIPSLGFVHLQPSDSYLQRYKQRVDNSYTLSLNRIVTSDWEQSVMKEMGRPVTGDVFYGVNFDQFYPVTTETTENTTLVALYRNKRHKGDTEVLDAFTELNSIRDDLEFIMFGTSKPKDVPSFIEFHEDPPQDSLRRLYSRGDLLVFPSWVEGYGMPPMEAMACRTGLISTDVGAVREYTPDDGARFVPIQDSGAIVSATEELLEQPEKIEQMKDSCYEHIQQFTWERSTSKFENHLKSIVN